jgi:hypothetical protein
VPSLLCLNLRVSKQHLCVLYIVILTTYDSPCASQLLKVKSSKKQPAHAHVLMLSPPAYDSNPQDPNQHRYRLSQRAKPVLATTLAAGGHSSTGQLHTHCRSVVHGNWVSSMWQFVQKYDWTNHQQGDCTKRDPVFHQKNPYENVKLSDMSRTC